MKTVKVRLFVETVCAYLISGGAKSQNRVKELNF